MIGTIAGRAACRSIHARLMVLAISLLQAVSAVAAPPGASGRGPSGAVPSARTGTAPEPVRIELRADDCRVGPDSQSAAGVVTHACDWTHPTAFTIAWTPREVRLTVGKTTVRKLGPWQTANGFHVAAAGSARVTIARVQDEWVHTVVSGLPSAGAVGEKWFSGASFADGWTLSGTIERTQPGAADSIVVTLGDDPNPAPTEIKPPTFTGGIAGPYAANPQPGGPLPVPPSRVRSGRLAAGASLTWIGTQSDAWSDARNWRPNQVPVTGDFLVFGQDGQNRKTTTNDLPNFVPGGITVQIGSYVVNGFGLTLPPGSTSTISGEFTVASLAGAGTVNFTKLFINQRVSTTFSGTLVGSELDLQNGSGAFTFTGNGSRVSATKVFSGKLDLDGGTLGDVYTQDGAFTSTFVMRNGATVGLVYGNSGILGGVDGGVGNTKTLTINGTTGFFQPISGPNDFQRLVVTGQVFLTGKLNVQLFNNYAPAVGTKFTIIDNDGTDNVVNTFQGLSEGATFDAGGVKFQISYKGGTGNDVVLTVIQGATPPTNPDLVIAKSHSPDSFVPRQQGTYTLTVRNVGNGPTSGADADPVTVLDRMPPLFQPISVVAPGWTCNLSGSPITCTRKDVLAAGASYPPIAITVQVAADAATSTNQAAVQGGGDATLASVDDPTPVIRAVDLKISKAHDQQFVQGSQGSYLLIVTNVGTSATSGTMTITDPMPAGVTARSATGDGWNCTVGATVTCTRTDSLVASATSELHIGVDVSPSAPATVTNTVTIAGGGDTNTANNSATDEAPVTAVTPELTLRKSHTGSFTQGQSGATFTLIVGNTGNGATTSTVSVDDDLPAGLTPTAAAGSGWTCTVTAPAVHCERADALAAGSSYPAITVTISVTASAQSTTNTATASGGGDPTPVTDTDPVTIASTPPDLTISKSHAGTVSQGGKVTFTIAVSNGGNNPTTGDVIVTDALPAGLTFDAVSGQDWDCHNAGNTVTCRRSDPLAGHDTAYPAISLTASVSATATSTVNEVSVSGGGDGSTGNNTATDQVDIGAVDPDLTVTKSHQDPFTAGQLDATFVVNVRNVGAAATRGTVTVTDNIPLGLIPRSGSGDGWSCSVAQQVMTCRRMDAIGSGDAYPTLTIHVDVALSAKSDLNEVDVAGGGDVSSGNNVATDAYTISGLPQLSVNKSHAGSFVQGQVGAVYTIAVRNRGSGPSIGAITLTDPVPAGLTPTAAAGDGWSCQIQGHLVTCVHTRPLLAQQASFVTITVDVAPTATSVVNIATINGGGDPTAPDNAGVDPTTILGRPELTISKSHADPVLQGQRGLQFTIGVFNNGTAETSGAVTVTDTIPAGLHPTDATGNGWTCSVAGQAVTCARADLLDANKSYDAIHISVDVAPNATSTTNTATVTGGGDTTPDDNAAADQVAISAPGTPNLVMAKQHDGNFAQGQSGAIYRLRVDNRGAVASTGPVTVTDDLPASLAPTAAAGDGWNCSIGGSRVTCTRADSLAASASWPLIRITVNVSATATDVINTAVLSGGNDSTPADNTASDPTRIALAAPDLTVAKSHQDPFLSGQTGAQYHITVANTGSGPTKGEVTVQDNVPAGMAPVSAGGSGWACAVASQLMTCKRSDVLAAGTQFPAITLVVNVAPNASSVPNDVQVSGGGDTTPGNNTATDFTNVNGAADAALALFLGGELIVGQQAEYIAQVRNLGPGTIGGVTQVVTTLPDALVPIVGVGSSWQCQSQGQQLICTTAEPLAPGGVFPDLHLRALVRTGPGEVTTGATVFASGDANPANDHAEVTSTSTRPVVALRIQKTASTDRVTIGGSVTYRVEIANVGNARVADAVVTDLLPRGFAFVDATSDLQSTTRSVRQVHLASNQDQLTWPLQTLSPGETVNVSYRVVIGADARSGPQDNKATASGAGPSGETVSAGPAIATVEVSGDTFTMLQALVGRVYEDVDRDGKFTSADRPIADARVITSTGQAAITDPDGLYNIPSLGAGSVAVSLDRSTIPGQLTTADDGPGSRSWTRLLRTPVGGGTVLRQNFALVAAQGSSIEQPPEVIAEGAPQPPATPLETPTGQLPPRRDYETRDGSSLLIALGEVSFGQAAPEFETFARDGDTWGYGSVFLQTPFGSPKNRLTLAYDTHRRLNGTTGQERLFELDPNDRLYPVFGDTSRRQEFATSNAKFFGRLERGQSHVMYGDLLGDLPSSDHDGGRWSSYQRHLTGAEVQVADSLGNGVTVRGAQPTTSYARDVFSGSALGLLTLTHGHVVPGTETIAVEVRDRRTPERVLSRDVLARAVDYELEPVTGAVFLQRHIGGLDSALNLVQVVATYEYEGVGVENMVYSGRGSWGYRGLRVGGTFFTEEGAGDGRFDVAGVDLQQQLPRGGHVRVEVPYSHGTPNVSTSIDTRPVGQSGSTDGFGLQAELDQPIAFWDGRISASVRAADQNFQNPFSSTITPGAQYATGGIDLSPRQPSRLHFGLTDEQYTSATVDAQRTTLSGSWSETIADRLTLTGGYDARRLDRGNTDLDSGLFTGAARLRLGSRFEASAAREQNVLDDTDPTYPDQTTLGARFKLRDDTNLFYTQRISDSPIVPIGDFTGTGFSQLPTRGELSLGVESRLADTTQLTSRYQVEQGLNGPDAFAVIGVATQISLGHGFSGTFGGDHGTLVSGQGDDYTSGTVGLAFLGADRFKASARYEARDRTGYAGLFTSGVAARLVGGVTSLFRAEWLDSRETPIQSHSLSLLGALAIRPVTNDRAGLLFSYQYVDRNDPVQVFSQPRDALGWRQRLSTDGYLQPLRRLEVYGKVAWQQTDDDPDRFVDTYLLQGRGQFTITRFVDLAIEQRYIWQQTTDSHRRNTGAEIGFWPLADFRAALGYSFEDSRDPLGRDLEGRARGIYVTLSTKLSRLFNLMGSAPPPR